MKKKKRKNQFSKKIEKNIYPILNIVLALFSIALFLLIGYALIAFFTVAGLLLNKAVSSLFTDIELLGEQILFFLVIFIVSGSYLIIALIPVLVSRNAGNFEKSLRITYSKSFKKSVNILKKYQYLIIAITLSLTLIFSGAMFIQEAYPGEKIFSEKGLISDSENSYLKCSGNSLNFIENKVYDCKIYFENNSIVNITKATENYQENEVKKLNNLTIIGKNYLKISMNNSVKTKFLNVYFEEENSEKFTINIIKTYTEKEYEEIKVRRISWIVGLLSLAIFSVFSVVNNAKNMIE